MMVASMNRTLQPFLLPISSRFKFLPQGTVLRITQRYFATITRTRRTTSKRGIGMLSTLDPNKLLPSDFKDISNTFLPTIYLSENPVDRVKRPRRGPRVYFDTRPTGRTPFPNHARGFFYYHVPANSPLASSIRFRCTSSNDPATFSDGRDLLRLNGLPWQWSLSYILAMRDPYFRDQFLKTGMVTEDQVTRMRRIFGQEIGSRYLVLHHLDQPFPLKFHLHGICLSAIIRDKLIRFNIMGIFVDWRHHMKKGKVCANPYQGSAVARFELSTLPEHSGHDTIVLRILKFVDPPTCTIPGYDAHVPVPIEGELVRCQHRGIWHRRIDGPGHAAEVFKGLVKDL